MKASISFPELQNILLEKIGQNILFGFVDEKTIHITYPLNLGFIRKDISANMIIKELRDKDLLVQVSAGLGTETLINTALNLLKSKIPEGLLEKLPDNHFMVHLGAIEQVKPVFDAINVSDFRVLDDGLQVEGSLKS